MPYFLIFSFLVFLVSLSDSASAAQTGADYRFTTAILTPFQKTIPLTADVAPRQASEVLAPRDGIIKQVYAWPGDEIGDGGTLARLDDSALIEKRNRLQAERDEYTAHLRRIEKLLEKKLVDTKMWDNNLQKLAQIRAEMAIVEEQIENSIIRAPKRGTVLWSDLQAGQEIKGAQPVFWLGDGKQMWLSTYMEEKYADGLKENDTVAIFVDDSSSPVLGQIDFISFGGPLGGNVNLYINAPRVAEIATKHKQNILVPIPSKESIVLLPEEILTQDGHFYKLQPIGSEPGKYVATRMKAFEINHENGVVQLRNVMPDDIVLLDPPENLENRALITAYEADEGWGEEYAAAILQKQQNDATGCGGGANADAAGGGSCSGGGGCGQAGGIQSVDPNDPEKNVCLVPVGLFEKPEIVIEEQMQNANGPTPGGARPIEELIPKDLPFTMPPTKG